MRELPIKENNMTYYKTRQALELIHGCRIKLRTYRQFRLLKKLH